MLKLNEDSSLKFDEEFAFKESHRESLLENPNENLSMEMLTLVDHGAIVVSTDLDSKF